VSGARKFPRPVATSSPFSPRTAIPINGDTAGARYEINHAGGRSYVTVNQGARLGLWSSLGQYNLYAGTSNMLA
jgi:hypothetical protein